MWDNQYTLYRNWKPQKRKYYHAPTGEIYDARVHDWKIGGLDETGSVIYIPVIEVEINGVLISNLKVKYPSKLMPKYGEK
jgi:hypothetical protein